jgi:flagellar basal-body rod modification protein FlgD
MDVASLANQTNALESATKQEKAVENPKAILGKDDFLKLLVAQLKYQDPLNPLNNDEFVQENTMFSQLEQLTNMNKSIKNMSSSFAQTDRGYAAMYLGKYISTGSNDITVNGSSVEPVSFNLTENADVKVSISNSKGENVANIDLGLLDKGPHQFKWDGKDNTGNHVESGQYSIILFARNENGQYVQVDKNAGKVVSVQFSSNGTMLVTDQNKKVKLQDVKSVFEGSA